MPFGVVIGLIILCAISAGIGSGTNSTAAVFAGVFFLSLLVLYFAPTVNAVRRDHPNKVSIIVLNVLLGWTLLGWIVALVWSYSAQQKVIAEVVVHQQTQAPPSSPSSDLRRCPFCAEDVRREAIKCKHCGSELTPV